MVVLLLCHFVVIIIDFGFECLLVVVSVSGLGFCCCVIACALVVVVWFDLVLWC